MVVLSLEKSISFSKVDEMYFQNTRSFPLSSGFNTRNKIPGSSVILLAIYAGNAKLCKE